jgi:hypothetical protein
VAGYGTSVEVPEAYDELTGTLLRAAQRRGRALDLTVRYRRRPGPSADWTSWELTANGAGVRIAAWARQLERELPIVAEGFTGVGAGRSAVRIARSLVARFIEWCVGDMLGEVGEKVVLTRDDDARVFWPLLDPPDLGHELAARLTLADELLARWMVGDLPDETGVEEMQTAIEIVLRRVLGAGQRVPFPELAERAAKHALIDEDDRRVLVDLNNRRVEIKHHGGVIPPESKDDARAVLYSAAWVLEQIEGQLAQATTGRRTPPTCLLDPERFGS